MENTPDAAPVSAPAPAPEAPASAPTSEATPNTNVNQGEANGNSGTPNTSNTPRVSERAQIPDSQVEAWNRFMEANGGFEKAFKKVKDSIANPQPKAETQTVGVVPEIVNQPQQFAQQTPPQKQDGFISPTEIAALQYNRMLSDSYPEISDYIAKGEYIKEAASLGVRVVDEFGNMNDKAIRQFLDLKKAAVPPAPTSNPITTTPTVEYVHAEGDITSQEMADSIMRQGNNHPRYNEAMQYTRERIFGKKPEPKQK